MKSIEELKIFYREKLYISLLPLERQRKKIVSVVGISGAVTAVMVLVICLIILASAGNSGLYFVFIPVLIGAAIFALVYYIVSKSYKRQFKSEIIGKLVKFFDDSLFFDQGSCIPGSQYMTSRIFPKNPDRYKGEDYVGGKLDKTAIEFSEVHSEYKTESRDSKGNVRTTWHTIFRGIFFIADFNKTFAGVTVVLPDTAERMFGFLGTMLQEYNFTRGKLIKLEDPKFEKEFAVYGDNQVTARYILSTSLMERIMEFKKKTGRPLHMSFVDSKVYIALSYNKNLFEPKLFTTLLDFNVVLEYYNDLALLTGIVEDLNLNTRIWTKE
ncbi:MAG: hypothetical protein A2452_00825 [Candidatus Firestonebacteria bacterium RIFOXYC2_FULL_39_67]|nr:MAG: hypothetical protein A2536_10785 [Candidatus Firestonebacteria bacterium RIFOXYD2_FULL_39_29]OGF53407.1 MAG: hypothetical protein A2497_03300 [Candidatus Firestonebacteria bacterium RifOxyC12_full_39_7]OGF54743.1 MAG: hypothetical protein A2452_00825 [Candidatus Firestonebacteria bacterium RIFOXYC2_FULL_39_67]